MNRYVITATGRLRDAHLRLEVTADLEHHNQAHEVLDEITREVARITGGRCAGRSIREVPRLDFPSGKRGATS